MGENTQEPVSGRPGRGGEQDGWPRGGGCEGGRLWLTLVDGLFAVTAADTDTVDNVTLLGLIDWKHSPRRIKQSASRSLISQFPPAVRSA